MSCTSCPMRVCPGTWLQTWVIGFLVVSGVVAGRVFCGWACPMGTLQDFLARVRKLRALKLPRFGKADHYLKGLKYLLLVVTIAAFYLLNERFAVPVRGHSNWSLDAVRVSWLTYDAASRVRVVILVAGVVLALGLARVWCRYLCPLGALLTIGNRISLLRLGRNMRLCSHCGKYPRECRTYTTPGTADCVICGDCIEGCPRRAVGFAVRYRRGVSGKSLPSSAAPEVIGPAAELSVTAHWRTSQNGNQASPEPGDPRVPGFLPPGGSREKPIPARAPGVGVEGP